MKKQYDFKIHPQDGEKGKILLGIPRERVYIPLFVDNRDKILQTLHDADRAAGYYQAEGHRVDRNRDDISEYFMNHPDKPEWLHMIDTDMEHPGDSGLRLTKWNKPIVGALYFHRGKTHDPFVFRRAPNQIDRFGRTAKVWQPLKDEVYSFLEACSLPIRDGSIVIDNPPIEPLLECDAVATGCMVIHRSVFEALPQPWWEYRDFGNSEDLIFCEEAKDIGVDIYCDLSTICGHYHWVPMGQAQFRSLYLAAGLNQTSYSKNTAIQWLEQFLDISKDDATHKIEAGNAHVVGDYWKRKFKDSTPSVEQVQSFYEDPFVGELYLIELIHWNFSAAFHNIRQMILPVRDKNVLEIGGGIGTVALQLALQNNNVVTAEVNPLLQDFIRYRTKWMEERVLAGGLGEIYVIGKEWAQTAEDEQFDTVVSFDTFEHLGAEDLQQLLKDLWRVLKPGGKIYYHANFGQQDIYPLHYNHSEMWDTWLIEAGFIPDSPVVAYKAKKYE